MPTEVEIPAPVNTAILAFIVPSYHAYMSFRECCLQKNYDGRRRDRGICIHGLK